MWKPACGCAQLLGSTGDDSELSEQGDGDENFVAFAGNFQTKRKAQPGGSTTIKRRSVMSITEFNERCAEADIQPDPSRMGWLRFVVERFGMTAVYRTQGMRGVVWRHTGTVRSKKNA